MRAWPIFITVLALSGCESQTDLELDRSTQSASAPSLGSNTGSRRAPCDLWRGVVDDGWLEEQLPILQARAQAVLSPANTSFGSDLNDATRALLGGSLDHPCFSMVAAGVWRGVFYQPRQPQITERSGPAVGFVRLAEQIYLQLADALEQTGDANSASASDVQALLERLRPRQPMAGRAHDATDYVQPYDAFTATPLAPEKCRGTNALLLYGPAQVHTIWHAPVGNAAPPP